jgi:hypothetical protein
MSLLLKLLLLLQCWAFSACMSLITAVTGFSAQRSNFQPDWDASDLTSSISWGPTGPAAQAAMRQLGAALAAEKAAAAAAAAAGGSLGLELRAAAANRRSTESDRWVNMFVVVRKVVVRIWLLAGRLQDVASAALTGTEGSSGQPTQHRQ